MEIIELREAGEDAGDLMGYYCRGHVDQAAFAAAANAYSGAVTSFDIRHVKPDKVRHVWWRAVQMQGQPKGTMEFKAALPGPGAWAATVATPITDRDIESVRRLMTEHDRGRLNGISEGVNWCLHQLGAFAPEVGEKLHRRFLEDRAKVEAAP